MDRKEILGYMAIVTATLMGIIAGMMLADYIVFGKLMF